MNILLVETFYVKDKEYMTWYIVCLHRSCSVQCFEGYVTTTLSLFSIKLADWKVKIGGCFQHKKCNSSGFMFSLTLNFSCECQLQSLVSQGITVNVRRQSLFSAARQKECQVVNLMHQVNNCQVDFITHHLSPCVWLFIQNGDMEKRWENASL